MAAVVIRDVRGAAELRACQALQRATWGITEDGYLLPVATMAAAQKMGGLVLGAFGPAGQLLGFAFAFLGKLRGRLVLYSQLTAVDPNAQRSGIGRQLKFEQRRRAAELGLETIVWAFDPLQASNAAFNLGVLGATCRTYEVDLYGPRQDALNIGLATDRLLAEWPTQGDVHGHRDDWPTAPDLIELDAHDQPRRADSAKWLGRPRVRLGIPAHLAALAERPQQAQQWQQAVRAAFQTAFAHGYAAVGFSRAEPDRPRYLLEARPEP